MKNYFFNSKLKGLIKFFCIVSLFVFYPESCSLTKVFTREVTVCAAQDGEIHF